MAVPAATHLQVEFVIIIADLKIELASAVHLARLSIIRRKTYNPVTRQALHYINEECFIKFHTYYEMLLQLYNETCSLIE